jgi:NAD(P)H dehydrogenase (quinone)
MKTKVAIIYYSASGTTYGIAREVENGAQAAGAETRLRKVKELVPPEIIQKNENWAAHLLETRDVPEATLEDLEWADAIVLGTPTRFGLPSSQLKHFIDSAGSLWAKGKLINKIASSFVTTGTVHGGQEATILALNNTFYHWGALIVSPGYADPIQFQSGNPYGTSFTSNNGTLPPDEIARAAARFQGKRVAQMAARLASAAAAA